MKVYIVVKCRKRVDGSYVGIYKTYSKALEHVQSALTIIMAHPDLYRQDIRYKIIETEI